MALLPSDPLALVGLGAVAVTIVALIASDWPRAYVLGVSTIVLYGLQFVDQAMNPTRLGLDALALSTDSLLAGAWWTPVSYAFLHASLFHIFGNLFILLTAGPALEESVGPRWFLIIYALGALAAAGAGVGLSLTTDIVASRSLMVGASGAIFGVLTAFAVRHPREKLPFILIFIVVWLPSMTVLLLYLGLNIAYMFTDTSIAWYGHFAGFLTGLALASVPALSPKTAPTEGLRLEGLSSFATTPRARDAIEHLETLEPGDDEELAHVWLEVLAEETRCPVCQSRVNRRGLRLVCQEGHDLQTIPDREKR